MRLAAQPRAHAATATRPKDIFFLLRLAPWLEAGAGLLVWFRCAWSSAAAVWRRVNHTAAPMLRTLVPVHRPLGLASVFGCARAALGAPLTSSPGPHHGGDGQGGQAAHAPQEPHARGSPRQQVRRRLNSSVLAPATILVTVIKRAALGHPRPRRVEAARLAAGMRPRFVLLLVLVVLAVCDPPPTDPLPHDLHLLTYGRPHAALPTGFGLYRCRVGARDRFVRARFSPSAAARRARRCRHCRPRTGASRHLPASMACCWGPRTPCSTAASTTSAPCLRPTSWC